MVNVTVSLPGDVASRVAAAAADRGVTVEELTSEALQAYLDHEQASTGAELSFIALGNAENGFSAREAERGSAGIPGESRAFGPLRCGDARVRAGISGILLRDVRGMDSLPEPQTAGCLTG